MLHGFEELDEAEAAEEHRLTLLWRVMGFMTSDQEGGESVTSLNIPLTHLFEEGSQARAVMAYHIDSWNFELAQLQDRLIWKCL